MARALFGHRHPTDAVMLALPKMKDSPPDLILSGSTAVPTSRRLTYRAPCRPRWGSWPESARCAQPKLSREGMGDTVPFAAPRLGHHALCPLVDAPMAPAR